MLERNRFGVLGINWLPHYDRYLTSDSRIAPSLAETFRSAAAIEGLEGIELVHPFQVRPNNVLEIKKMLGDAGLTPISIAASLSSKPQYRLGSLTADLPETRQQAIDTVKTAIDCAAELGIELVTVWMGRDGFDNPFQVDYEQSWGRLFEAFKEICFHRPEMRIGIEYKIKEPRRWLFASTASRILLLAHELQAPNLGALLDIGHALMAYENLGEVVYLLARENRLFNVHLNDNTRIWDDDMPMGSLHLLEHLELLYWLDRVGYDGWLSFDVHAILEDPTRLVEESLHFTRGMIQVMNEIGRPAIEAAIQTRQVSEIMALVGKTIFPKAYK